ncbi:MAG: LLM class flavin-dependent oxidoreductase [Nitriliruptorales bacterium]|nr:LLM class flavin-dependent oxidoreductase [Nitriliruptorales bacterium]
MDVKYGLWLRNGPALSAAECVEWAVAAEEGGWDGVFASEAIEDGFTDPWATLAAVAAATERITLGTWITAVPNQQPGRLANTAATLDQLSGGRVMLGAGLGARYEYETFGVEYDAKRLGDRYDEALEVITKLWSGETVDHDGEFFTVREATLQTLPVQEPRIPIVVAAWWPAKRPLRRGAQWDGIMPSWPAMMGGEEGPEGQQPTGKSVADEFRELMDYYHDQTDDPGEVVAPALRDDEYLSICEELGVTWLLRGSIDSIEDLRDGPEALV